MLSYVCEWWTLTANVAEMLEYMQGNCSDKLMAQQMKWESGKLVITMSYNQLHKEPRLSKYIRLKCLQLAEHLQNMSEKRISKKPSLDKCGERDLLKNLKCDREMWLLKMRCEWRVL